MAKSKLEPQGWSQTNKKPKKGKSYPTDPFKGKVKTRNFETVPQYDVGHNNPM